MELTEKQRQVLDCIKRMTVNKGFPPTRKEIAAAMGFRSPNAAEDYIRALERKGALYVTRGVARGLLVA